MPELKADFIAAGSELPTREELEAVHKLTEHLLGLAVIREARPNLALNALLSAYWSLAMETGRDVRAAEGLVQLDGQHLARLMLAQRAAEHASGIDDQPPSRVH